MIVAPDATLDLVAPLVPEALFVSSARSAVQAVTRGLPKAASGIALECRLDETTRVDFLMYLLARADGHRALLRDAPARGTPAWRGVLDFCQEWAEPASLLHAEVPALWLEFDVKGEPGAAPRPLPFPCIERHISEEQPPEEQDERGRAVCLDLLDRATSLLLEHPLPCATYDTAVRVVKRLPRRGRVLHVAPLDSRGLDALRLVATIPRDELPAYLDQIEWPSEHTQLDSLLATLVPEDTRLGFHLDVNASVLPTLGLELHHVPGDPRWRPLLDDLVARGACTPGKRDALLEFPPFARLALPSHRVASPVSTTLGIKLILAPGEPVAAKAYLGFVPLHPLFG
ncbi:hypothetical protein [Polyangium mundeleinium]|uniref:Uncharacterized protein n=1 Tax=Polyangium mundeleinium TaxID=2995306 RepID=A0ABT5ES52_9BACT|nr:hypothetical protein [Polyangium mundeleinium]MDC0744645.1 hypothetical protein [Polyangium mundeleinium]